ncbi:MAG TPA: Rrf2 family transcriptional regulator [Candidatus Omnitrophota bacterium]|nr:Rrf2 family transcriptional regulator [Candidatus Omnitrophota bacterium]
MRYTTKTEYGVICLAYMAMPGRTVGSTAKEIAECGGFSVPFTEKILQKLRKTGMVSSQQGNRGGWTLARAPREISLKEIVEALEGSTFETFCDSKRRGSMECRHFSVCKLKPIWYRTKDTLDNLYEKITLDQIARDLMGSKSSRFLERKRKERS